MDLIYKVLPWANWDFSIHYPNGMAPHSMEYYFKWLSVDYTVLSQGWYFQSAKIGSEVLSDGKSEHNSHGTTAATVGA